MDSSSHARVRRRQRAAIGVLVLALHALLALALLTTLAKQRAQPESPRVSVRLLPAPTRIAPQPLPGVAAARPPSAATVHAPTRARASTRPAEDAVEAPGRPMPLDTAPPRTAEAASAPTSPDTDLLDTAASRRALRSAAGNLNLASRVNAQLGVHSPTTAQRLPGSIQQAGKGDCSKGEYPGAGMGLLSLPFIAAALAAGNCAQ